MSDPAVNGDTRPDALARDRFGSAKSEAGPPRAAGFDRSSQRPESRFFLDRDRPERWDAAVGAPNPDPKRSPDTERSPGPLVEPGVASPAIHWATPLGQASFWGAGAAFASAAGLLIGLYEGGAEGAPWRQVLAPQLIGLGLLTAVSLGFLYRLLYAHTTERARLGAITAAFDSTPNACVIADPAGAAIYANAAFRLLFGPKEWRFHGAFAHAGTSASPPVVAALERLCGGEGGSMREIWRLLEDARAGRGGATEFPLPGASGSSESSDPLAREWRNVSVHPIAGLDGHTLWSIDDITDYWQAEARWRSEQAKLADLLGRLPMGLYSVDQAGRFRIVNDIFAEWLGYKPDELVGGETRLHAFLAPRPRTGQEPHDPFTRKEGDNRSLVRFKARDGSIIDARVAQTVSRSRRSPSGEARFWTRTVVRRLSMKDDWEEALRRSEQRFQRIFEEAPLGIVLVDATGRITATNHAFRSMAPRQSGRVVGKPLSDFLHHEDANAVAARLEAMSSEVAGETKDATPLDVRMAGGRGILASLFLSRSEDSIGAPTGFILQFLNITEEKKLEHQFAQSQKMQAIGQLAGGVAHDFNNLLTAIGGNCDLMLARHHPGEQSFVDLMQVKQLTDRAANLVRQLLAFSRQQPLQPRVLDIIAVLAELSHLLRRLIGENIELKMNYGRDPFLVKVDKGQLEQVILNLAVNARDAMQASQRQGGVLTVTTSNMTVKRRFSRQGEEVPPGDYLAIEVADTGGGIPKDVIDRIFEPFFSTKDVGAGTGLGLSTVHGIVHQTGGFVFADSRMEEKQDDEEGDRPRGATFTIYLPRFAGIEETETAKPDPARTASDLTGVGTIVLVEDEEAVRRFSAKALKRKGYTVLEAASGHDALDLLAKPGRRVDLVVTDVVMPQMDGLELIRQVRERRAADGDEDEPLRVIFMSGYAEEDFRERLGADSDIHFLSKPFSMRDLAAKVKDVLAG